MFIQHQMREVVLVGLMFAIPLTSARGDTNAFRPLKASRLIGMKVEDRDGQQAGKLWDLALDLQNGRLKYVIVASGGVLGVRPKLRAVPPETVYAATTKRDTLGLHVIKAEFDRAPVVRASEIAALGQPERAAAIDRFYGHSPPEPSTPRDQVSLAATGNSTGARSSNTPLKLTGDLVGKRVVNRQHEKLGEVLDLLVDFRGDKPVFAIVSAGKFFKDGEHQYAIPLRALQPTDASSEWKIEATRPSLAQARPLDWQSTPSDATIYRYEEPERGRGGTR